VHGAQEEEEEEKNNIKNFPKQLKKKCNFPLVELEKKMNR